jgi:hypothetical protein
MEKSQSFLGDSVGGEYYRINETKVQCMERLLLGCKANSLALLSADGKVSIKSTTLFSDPKECIPGTIRSISKSQRYFDSYDIKEYEPEDSSYFYEFTSTKDNAFIGLINKEYTRNLVTNLKFSKTRRCMIVMEYGYVYKYSIGDVMKFDYPTLNISSLITLDIVTEFIENGNIISKVTFGGLKDGN